MLVVFRLLWAWSKFWMWFGPIPLFVYFFLVWQKTSDYFPLLFLLLRYLIKERKGLLLHVTPCWSLVINTPWKTSFVHSFHFSTIVFRTNFLMVLAKKKWIDLGALQIEIFGAYIYSNIYRNYFWPNISKLEFFTKRDVNLANVALGNKTPPWAAFLTWNSLIAVLLDGKISSHKVL